MDKNTYIMEKLYVENAQLRLKILEMEFQILELNKKLNEPVNQNAEN